ncbi:MAG TPA: lipopolysaccharide heptosyltransferase II [Methylomirabilota bacterium]|nr:lipopolysaccharide heptosyltransferase II [Methylomirabilota bacterium]
MEDSPAVIVVRAPNWLGDTVMALPALRALHAARPASRITVVGPWAPLLSGQGVGDILLPYPHGLGERRRLARALRPERPELAVLLPNSFESALAAWRWGARRRVGFDADGRGALLTDAIPLPSPRQHQVDEYATLIAFLGVPVEERLPVWRLPEDRLETQKVTALLAQAGAAADKRLVGLHLGAAFGSSKLWPSEFFGRLAGRLLEEGAQPVLMGVPADERTAAAVVQSARCAVPSLVGRDRAASLPRLLARLDCLVSGDTGVAHLAAALRIPTVTLFGPTDKRLTAPRSVSAQVLDHDAPCAPCFLPACPIDHICLRGIGPDEVHARVRQAIRA